MEIFNIALFLTTLSCSLVTGFLFAFAIVVMPGIKVLNDRQFLNAFRVIDKVIQNNQPVFMLVWVGSIILIIVTALLGLFYLGGAMRIIMIITSLIYLFGVQLPTIVFNIPLNNMVQSIDFDSPDLKALRESFETSWNRWNKIRTVLSIMVTLLLLILLLNI